MLVNYFARELPAKWRYDEFESGTVSKLCSFCVASAPGRYENKLFENLVQKGKRSFGPTHKLAHSRQNQARMGTESACSFRDLRMTNLSRV